ncbi:hypothetical protein OAO50_06400 [Paracoccaceae bacterium]|nr:hypothetical protein [Paracoccaceae bacterium]
MPDGLLLFPMGPRGLAVRQNPAELAQPVVRSCGVVLALAVTKYRLVLEPEVYGPSSTVDETLD